MTAPDLDALSRDLCASMWPMEQRWDPHLRVVVSRFLASPAMLARDAALVQQARDEAVTESRARIARHHRSEGRKEGRAEVAAAVEAAMVQDGRMYNVTQAAVRAAVASAGASDLATIRAEAVDRALRKAADNLPVSRPGQSQQWSADWLRRRADGFQAHLVAAEAGERTLGAPDLPACVVTDCPHTMAACPTHCSSCGGDRATAPPCQRNPETGQGGHSWSTGLPTRAVDAGERQ